MLNKKIVFGFIGIIFINVLNAQNNKKQIYFAEKMFKNVKEICDKDNGNLWGKNLYCPVLVINKKTKYVVANEKDNENYLTKNDNVYTGIYPESKIVANSTGNYGNKLWATLVYPFNEIKFKEEETFIHEMFHNYQKNNWLSNFSRDNSHTDNFDSRCLLKLEWNALAKAIRFDSIERKKAITDALIFRKYRRSLYIDSDSNENRFEIYEGLAEYTGIKLTSENIMILNENVNKLFKYIYNNKSFSSSFGYLSGLMYAVILDESNCNWRKNFNPNCDIGVLTQNAYKIDIPNNIDSSLVNQIKYKYGYDDIYKCESKLKAKRDKIISNYINKFTKERVLIIDLEEACYGYGPGTLIPINLLGTVFPYIILSDKWGVLNVLDGGCLVAQEKGQAFVPVKNIKIGTSVIEDKNWKLKLNENYKVIKEGINYKVVKK